MRRIMRNALLSMLLLVVCACGGSDAHDDTSTPSPQPPVLSRELVRDFVAFDTEGDLAVVDSATGEVLSSSKGEGLVPRDIVFDRWKRRVVTFESSSEDDGGEIATRSLADVHTLGPRESIAPVDGDVRLLASPIGILVFEEGYGHRWRVIRNDGKFRPSIGVALPTSVLVDSSTNSLLALVHDDRFSIARARLDAPLEVDLKPIETSLSDSARVLPRAIVDVGPKLVRFDGSTQSLAKSDAPVVAALSLDGDSIAVILTEPASLHACALSPEGDLEGHDIATLEGRVDGRDRMFTRALVRVGRHRVVVATTAGLYAYDLVGERSTLRLRRDETFRRGSLRGPIAVLE